MVVRLDGLVCWLRQQTQFVESADLVCTSQASSLRRNQYILIALQ